MQRRYSSESEPDERQPLEAYGERLPSPPPYYDPPRLDTDPARPLDSGDGDDLVSPLSPAQTMAAADDDEQPPPPPQHRTAYAPSAVTPGADNFGDAAAGGMAGIAYTVAEHTARASGLHAMEDAYDLPERRRQSPGRSTPSSLRGLGGAAPTPGSATPGSRTASRSAHSFVTDMYADDPYQGYTAQDPTLGYLDPSAIADDGDDGLDYTSRGGGGGAGSRLSVMGLGQNRRRSRGLPAGAVAGGAAAGGAAAAAAGTAGSRAANLDFTSVRQGVYPGGPYGFNRAAEDVRAAGFIEEPPKESAWLAQQDASSRRWRWAIILGLGVAAVAAIVCGVVFGAVLKHKSSGSSSSDSSSSGDSDSNDSSTGLTRNSKTIQKLLNNTELHKVFPGIDYTPINTQYPACLTDPPLQDNVTQDVAVLSQLTNTIRLYGTDCNQTEMTLTALERLALNGTVKLWLGVWQDGNATTNARQLAQMWDILDAQGPDPFAGILVANEILFREEMTVTELGSLLTDVRANLSAHGAADLPVATSDLGSEWTAALAEASDYVMANVHPFFGGINASAAAAWTVEYWTESVAPYFEANASRNVISETGWPTEGGTDCGSGSNETDCPDHAVAGIAELNRFMADWVCAALTNGTQYFWFEAFDEPWKIAYDTDTAAWEDHWGLFDVNRVLKEGVKIPDCGVEVEGWV